MENINIYLEIEKLLAFAESVKFIEKEDIIYSRNKLLSVFGLNDCEEVTEKIEIEKPYEILNRMCDWASEKGIIENTFDERDLFDTKIMGELTICGFKKLIPIDIKVLNTTKGVNVSGTYDMKMTDFKIDPPTALMGTIKTGDEISIHFNTNFKYTKNL